MRTIHTMMMKLHTCLEVALVQQVTMVDTAVSMSITWYRMVMQCKAHHVERRQRHLAHITYNATLITMCSKYALVCIVCMRARARIYAYCDAGGE